MLQETAQIYTDEIKLEAAQRFGIDPLSLEALEGFENYVYVGKVDSVRHILRVTHSLHRSEEHICSEVTWVNDMAARSIPVVAARQSKHDRFVEVIPHEPSGTYFCAAMFEYAPGVLLDDDPEAKAKYWNADLFEQWGEVLAQIHNHAQHHALQLNIRRPQWHEYDVLDLPRFIPSDQTQLLEIAQTHLNKLHALPTSPEVYGLTHADLTQWNFNVNDGKLTVYDFDSSEYGWFAKDLAVSLYYAAASYEGEAPIAFNQKFFEHLIRGYRRTRTISDAWLERIPDFLFLQRIILYAYSHQLGDAEDPTDEDRAFLDRTRKIIELGEEPIKLDFRKIRP